MKLNTVTLLAAIGGASSFSAPSTLQASSVVSTTRSSTAAPTETAVVDGAVVMKGPIESGMDEQELSSTSSDSADRIKPGRYNNVENSVAIPFLPRPPALDGTHAGDFGFDPLGLSESQDLYVMQESELRHGRLAMLAVVGWPLSELLAPDWMLQQNGCAPSVLNGFNPLTFVATALFFGGAGYFEYKTALRMKMTTESGKMHYDDMSNVWEYGVAGDYNFDPMGWYSLLGDNANSRKAMRDVEISHGRSAMLGITAFALWEKLTGHPIVENSMFFHPNLLLPFLVVAGGIGSQIYEVSPLDEYPIRVEVTSEGEMKLGQLKRSLQGPMDTMSAVTERAVKLEEEYGLLEKASKVPGKAIEAVKSTYPYWQDEA